MGNFDLIKISFSGSASELGRQISADPKTPGGPGSCSTIAEEAVDQLQENEKLVAGERNIYNLDVELIEYVSCKFSLGFSLFVVGWLNERIFFS